MSDGEPGGAAQHPPLESVPHWQAHVLAHVRQLGADHEATLSARSNLAHHRGLAGDPIAALVDLKILTTRCLDVLGAEHPTTVTVGGLRAYWLGVNGERAAALAIYERLWPNAVRILGPDHLTTLSIRYNYSAVRDWTDNPADALAAYDEMLAAYRQLLGPDDPTTRTVAATVEYWRSQLEDLADIARDIYTDMALQASGSDGLSDDQERIVDERVEEFVSADQSLIDGVVELRRYLDQDTAERGPHDPQTLETRRMLADQKLLTGDIDAGLTDYQTLISDCTRVYGRTHQLTFHARRHHAFALAHTGSGISSRNTALKALLAEYISDAGPHDRHAMLLRVDVAVYCHRSDAELHAVLADPVQVLGPDHRDVGETRKWLISLAASDRLRG